MTQLYSEENPDTIDSKSVPEIWFELSFEPYGWAVLTFGVDADARACTQTTTIQLSPVWDPFPKLIKMAELAATEEPTTFKFTIDSEGPCSDFSIAEGPAPGLVHFVVDDSDYYVTHFSAILSSRQFGVALGMCVQSAIRNPDFAEHWSAWLSEGGAPAPRGEEKKYFANEWLKSLSEGERPN